MQGRFWLGFLCLLVVIGLIYHQSTISTRATWQPAVNNMAGIIVLTGIGTYLVLSSVLDKSVTRPRDTLLGYVLSGLLVIGACVIVVVFLGVRHG